MGWVARHHGALGCRALTTRVPAVPAPVEAPLLGGLDHPLRHVRLDRRHARRLSVDGGIALDRVGSGVDVDRQAPRVVGEVLRIAARAAPSAVAVGAAERVAAAVPNAVSLGADLVEEPLEQGLYGNVRAQGAGAQAGDRLGVGGDVVRLPGGEGGRAVVPVAAPLPAVTDARRGRNAPPGRGRLVVEGDHAPGDIAGLDLLGGAAGRSRRQHPRRVVQCLGDRCRGRERPDGGAGDDGERGRHQTEEARCLAIHREYMSISVATPATFIWKGSRCAVRGADPSRGRCRTPSLGWPA